MHKCLKGAGEEDEDRPGEWTRGNKHKLKHTEGSIEVEGRHYCKGDCAGAQDTQKCCGVSILEDIKKLSGRGLGQLAVGGFA